MQLPQEVIGVLPAVHPILPDLGQQERRNDLNPQRAQFIGQTEYDAAAKERVGAIMQDRNHNRGHNAASHEGLHAGGHHVPPDHVLLRLGLVIGPDAFQRQHDDEGDEGVEVRECLQHIRTAHVVRQGRETYREHWQYEVGCLIEKHFKHCVGSLLFF